MDPMELGAKGFQRTQTPLSGSDEGAWPFQFGLSTPHHECYTGKEGHTFAVLLDVGGTRGENDACVAEVET